MNDYRNVPMSNRTPIGTGAGEAVEAVQSHVDAVCNALRRLDSVAEQMQDFVAAIQQQPTVASVKQLQDHHNPSLIECLERAPNHVHEKVTEMQNLIVKARELLRV